MESLYSGDASNRDVSNCRLGEMPAQPRVHTSFIWLGCMKICRVECVLDYEIFLSDVTLTIDYQALSDL